ncbi:hypothetical protein EFR84_27030 [Rhizobium chutanense]|uniref:Uncharacterized protein n=1 Tax=Rhizobium chutanense TaxID=2035448 RepID=A0A3S0QLV0_9HYPH|nr:hypothetical protein EFR84_27030 [Rhizobium chutanense]
MSSESLSGPSSCWWRSRRWDAISCWRRQPWDWPDALAADRRIQRDIYVAFADHIKSFASGSGWFAFLAFLPMGIAFGAILLAVAIHEIFF